MRKTRFPFLTALTAAALCLCTVLPVQAAGGAPAGFVPEPLSKAELAYDRVSPYDAADAAAKAEQATAEDSLPLERFALQRYDTGNADTCYRFLRGELGMTNAQACGVMASFYTESRFLPTAYLPSDTNGLASYGLCQWNGPRYDKLREWCGEHGYDYTSLDGQLHYLQYEVTETWEKRIWSYLNVPETEDGAWEAGYAWARYFERGASKYWNSRGDYARDFWAIYNTWQAPTPVPTPAPTPSIDPSLIPSFVTRLYSVCLGREPDAPGFADWSAQLQSGRQNGAQVAYGFVFSAEFKAKNYCNEHYVTQLYRLFLDREPDKSGLADWAARLESGQTREAVFNGFVGSEEFSAICARAGIARGDGVPVPAYGTVPQGPCSYPDCGREDGVTAFVKRLYKVCLDREADAAGLKDWTNRLWSQAASGRDVVYGFIFSDEFQKKGHDDATYVEYLYKAFFDRAPDTLGRADWLGRMAGGWRREQVFEGFVGSDEFTRLCQHYGIVRG